MMTLRPPTEMDVLLLSVLVEQSMTSALLLEETVSLEAGTTAEELAGSVALDAGTISVVPRFQGL